MAPPHHALCPTPFHCPPFQTPPPSLRKVTFQRGKPSGHALSPPQLRTLLLAFSSFPPPTQKTGSRLPLGGSCAASGSSVDPGSVPRCSAGRRRRVTGVKGWDSTSGSKMAAVVAVSLRRRFPATTLGRACLQVSFGSGVGRAGMKVQRWLAVEGAAEEIEGRTGPGLREEDSSSRLPRALILDGSIPAGYISAPLCSL